MSVQTSHMKEMYFDPTLLNTTGTRWWMDGSYHHVPDLNQRNRHVAKYLIQNSIWWIEYSGVDVSGKTPTLMPITI